MADFQGAKGTAINCFYHWLLKSMVLNIAVAQTHLQPALSDG